MTKMQHKPFIPTAPQAYGSKEVIKLQAWMESLERELDVMLEKVSALVRQESPTNLPDAVDAAQNLVTTWTEELGATVTQHSRSGNGGILEACCWATWIQCGRWGRWRACPGG